MRTRSSDSTTDSNRKKNKRKKIEFESNDDFFNEPKNNEGENEDDVGRQLVMRPNFNSRRKRPKEPVIDGNWIETTKKGENEIDKVATSQSSSERFSSPSSPLQSKSSSSHSNHKNAELHFNFSLLANRMEKAGGFGNTEISFSSKDLFKHINPAAHPDSFKHELKKFGDTILDNSSEIRDMLGFDQKSASGIWKKSNNDDEK